MADKISTLLGGGMKSHAFFPPPWQRITSTLLGGMKSYAFATPWQKRKKRCLALSSGLERCGVLSPSKLPFAAEATRRVR
mmetsp:Transcript_30181/g.47263  ORF Transcript_30181/g.47263 Transcript_30181/m.47263 type:complete len:80 (-) Transcript_30181:237-476(-)